MLYSAKVLPWSATATERSLFGMQLDVFAHNTIITRTHKWTTHLQSLIGKEGKEKGKGRRPGPMMLGGLAGHGALTPAAATEVEALAAAHPEAGACVRALAAGAARLFGRPASGWLPGSAGPRVHPIPFGESITAGPASPSSHPNHHPYLATSIAAGDGALLSHLRYCYG